MRLMPPSGQRRPDPPPLATNDRAAVLAGTAVWVVVLVGTLLFRGRLDDSGRGWWVWTPVAGLAIGVYGLFYLRRRGR